ncbi:hypothetical protein PUMCH_003951 [Australozyma saopauloensis]|uniref:Phosphoglycerate mutase n=1 Tax=Australozyma saopauloensis TaxID=291208 RepID=A0AAX4HDY3_9ASCO|nr:hypothetical protein PUMCH_003951 [[Candida] saopauloensis]
MTREIVGNSDSGKIRIFVVRHGKTDWNAKKILQGHINIDMNDEGKDQARKLGEHFKEIQLDNVVSSDLSRCVETAKFIVDEQKGPEYQETTHLRERNMGKVQGMPLDQALAEYGEDFRNFGEKSDALILRVSEVWNGAIKNAKVKGHKNVLLCTHGGVIRAFINHLHDGLQYGLGNGLYREDLRVPYNTSISVIDIDVASGQGTIQKFGVTEHLGGDFRVTNQLLR